MGAKGSAPEAGIPWWAMEGMGMGLAPLTWAKVFTTWRFSPITAILVAVALLCYVAGAVAVNRRGDGERWPLWRSICFAAGLAVVVAAIMGSPGVYGDVLLWVHMFQHLMLIMVAPWLLCYGRPMNLTLRATRGRAHERAEALLSSRLVAFITFPLLTLALYVAVIVGIHLSGIMNAMADHAWIMSVEHVLYLVAGYLYFSRILTDDGPRPGVPLPLRLFSLFMAMSADTVVGVVLLQATMSPFPAYAAMQPSWGPGALNDAHGAGTVMWIGGDGLMLIMMIVVAVKWMGDRSAATDRVGAFLESARRSALAGDGAPVAVGSADVDTDEGALDAYNAMLARLNRRSSGED
jgi:putative copper resistance protein D